MTRRILSTLGLWLLLFALIFQFGPAGVIWLLALTTAAAQWELYDILTRLGYKPYRRMGVALGFIQVIGGYHVPEAHDSLIVLAVLLPAFTLLGRKPDEFPLPAIVPTYFGILYIPVMIGFLVKFVLGAETQEQGLALAILVVSMAKFTDVGGLVFGLRFGRNKLAPAISPGKSWEGVAGGLLTSSLVCGAAVALLPAGTFPEGLSPVMAGLVALPVGAVSVASDLVESVFKRRAGVKDSGQLVPGIGGAFDLLDSIILSAPLGYLLCRLLHVI